MNLYGCMIYMIFLYKLISIILYIKIKQSKNKLYLEKYFTPIYSENVKYLQTKDSYIKKYKVFTC